MAKTRRVAVTDEERAERRKREQQLTERAVAQLRCSAGWQRWLTVRARMGLRRYTVFICSGCVQPACGGRIAVGDMSPTERMVPRAVAVGAEAEVGGRAATRRFLAALYRSAPAGSLVEIRFSVASGMGRRFHRVAAIERVVDAVAGLARWTDAYVGVIPRRRGGRRDDLVEPAGVVWVDCDNGERIASA